MTELMWAIYFLVALVFAGGQAWSNAQAWPVMGTNPNPIVSGLLWPLTMIVMAGMLIYALAARSLKENDHD